MISTAFELSGLGVLVYAAYELAGRGVAAVVLGLALLFVGYSLDGVRIRLPIRKRKPKRRVTEEPLTNRKIAEAEAGD